MIKPTTEFANIACMAVVEKMINDLLDSFEPEERMGALAEIKHVEVLRNMIDDHHPMAKFREYMLSFFSQIIGTLVQSGRLSIAVKVEIKREADGFNVQFECHQPEDFLEPSLLLSFDDLNTGAPDNVKRCVVEVINGMLAFFQYKEMTGEQRDKFFQACPVRAMLRQVNKEPVDEVFIAAVKKELSALGEAIGQECSFMIHSVKLNGNGIYELYAIPNQTAEEQKVAA